MEFDLTKKGKMKKTIFLLALCSTSTVMADEFEPVQNSYSSISYVNAKYEGVSATGAAFTVGSYLNDNYGYVISIAAYGAENDTVSRGIAIHAEGTSVSVSAGPSYYLTENLSIYGLLGMTFHRLDVTATNGYITASNSADGKGFTYGIGMNYALNDKWSLNAMMDKSSGSLDDYNVSVNTKTVSVGVGYSF